MKGKIMNKKVKLTPELKQSLNKLGKFADSYLKDKKSTDVKLTPKMKKLTKSWVKQLNENCN